TAGTPGTAVLAIQGVSSGTAVPVSLSATANVAEQNGSAYPNKSNFQSGAASATGTTQTTVIASPGSNKLYITDVQIGRTDAGTTAISVSLNDTATTV